MVPKRIIWHHTADDSQSPQFEKINAYHRSRDFPKSSLGYYVGYHYLIEPDGTVRQARKNNEIGAHDKDENYDSIGIALAGNFNYHTIGEAQSIALAKLMTQIFKEAGITLANVEPHRWNDATDCPGRFLSDAWIVENYVARENPPIESIPPPKIEHDFPDMHGRFSYKKLSWTMPFFILASSSFSILF